MDSTVWGMMPSSAATTSMAISVIMAPRARMEVVDIEDSLNDIIEQVRRTAHSRFPVIEDSRDNVIGILLAKDLLRIRQSRPFKLRDLLRPAVFIPDSKRLNVLLREFRVSRNHMAIVIDEYAGVSGLITIEDVLEQIVGEIEDEYDFDESEGNIRPDQFGRFRVKAQTSVEDFNEHFASQFSSDECNTVGGLILNHLGRVPRRKEEIALDGLNFVVLRADRRRLYTLLVTREQAPDEAS